MKSNHKMELSIPLLIALVGLPQISETIYTPALPSVASGLSTSPYMVEATLAIYFLGFACGVILWGILSDSRGRRSSMLVGLLIYLVSTIACANVASIEALLAYRFIQAFGASVGSVITQTILRDAFEGAKRAQLFAVMSGALAFTPAIGPILGGFISEYMGWRANFAVLAVISLLLVIWVLGALPETRPQGLKRVSLRMILDLGREMFQSRALWGHVLLIGATNGIIFGFYQEAPFVFIEQMGLPPSHYGFFGVLIAVATMIAARISHQQSRRLSAEAIILSGAVCISAGGILLTLNCFTGVYMEAIGPVLIISTFFLIFFGIGLVIPNSLSHALKAYHATAGTAGALFGGAYYGFVAACTWVMSVIHDETGLPLALYILTLGAVTLIGSLLNCSSAAKASDATCGGRSA